VNRVPAASARSRPLAQVSVGPPAPAKSADVTIPMALARRTGSSDRGCRNGNGLDGVDELPERGAERIVERSVDLEASVIG
jgi:hypothetical protein